MTMWQSGGMGGGGHGSQNNPWMKLMGIVHKERRHTDNITSQSGSNERNLNHRELYMEEHMGSTISEASLTQRHLLISVYLSLFHNPVLSNWPENSLELLKLNFRHFYMKIAIFLILSSSRCYPCQKVALKGGLCFA
uniref:Uncharacterized protein n=1 Tax=Glossina pallidipes TaxID=7398 RepID=A0A1B0ADM1_GLOPL